MNDSASILPSPANQEHFWERGRWYILNTVLQFHFPDELCQNLESISLILAFSSEKNSIYSWPYVKLHLWKKTTTQTNTKHQLNHHPSTLWHAGSF